VVEIVNPPQSSVVMNVPEGAADGVLGDGDEAFGDGEEVTGEVTAGLVGPGGVAGPGGLAGTVQPANANAPTTATHRARDTSPA